MVNHSDEVLDQESPSCSQDTVSIVKDLQDVVWQSVKLEIKCVAPERVEIRGRIAGRHCVVHSCGVALLPCSRDRKCTEVLDDFTDDL